MSYTNRKFNWDLDALKRFYNNYVIKWINSAMAWTDAQVARARANVGGTVDVSVLNAVQGTPATYESLTAALEAVPQVYKRGGMSVKFIQGSVPSSDNKYVQARCMANEFTTAVTQWQGVDDELKADSKNLVENGTVFAELNTPIYNNITLENYITGYIKSNGNKESSSSYRIYYIPCEKGDKFKLSFQAFSSTVARAYGIYSTNNIDDISSSNKITIGPVGSAGTEYDIEVSSADAKLLCIQEYYAYGVSQYGANLKKFGYINKFDSLLDSMIRTKDWTIGGNVVYDSNEIPCEYDITWADGTIGRVVCSNFNDNVFEYTIITATYGNKTATYSFTFDSNGYITNEIINIL